MLSGRQVRKEFILALLTAVLLMAAPSRATGFVLDLAGGCSSAIFFVEADLAVGDPCHDVQFVNYFSNAAPGDGSGKSGGWLRVTDPLELTTSGASTFQPEEICSMIYVFDIREGLQECCGCPVTADGLLSLTYGNPSGDLNTNPRSATGQFFYANSAGSGVLWDGVIRILSTTTNATTTPSPNTAIEGTDTPNGHGIYCDPFSGACCNPGASTLTLVTTLRAWIDHIQNSTWTDTEFEENPITPDDANTLANLCEDTITEGTVGGYCSCGNEVSEGTGGF